MHPLPQATVNADCASSSACQGVSNKTVSTSCAGGDASCVDANVRNDYSTSLDFAGLPVNFTRWRTYDPRMRPWYIEAKELWLASARKFGYSQIYPFATSGELGITATGAIIVNGSLQVWSLRHAAACSKFLT